MAPTNQIKRLAAPYIIGFLWIIADVRAMERVYFIAAEEVEWNYAPTGANLQNTDRQLQADEYMKSDVDRIGSTYKKVMYKHYTDDNYKVEWPQPGYMGLIGPVIRAEVGDTVKIRFKNLASRPYSIYSHGVSYGKDSEGALYVDGSSGTSKSDDVVSPGKSHTYLWEVTKGPSDSDPNCIPWVYHSHINVARDTNSGLVGVLLTCKNGTLNQDDTRKDVDDELVVFSKVFDENQSWYLEENMETCGTPEDCMTLRQKGDPEWVRTNLKHSINGMFYGNMEEMAPCAGDHVAVYFLSFGDELDTSTTLIEGQVLDFHGRRTSAIPVFPGTAEVASLIPRNPGSYKVMSVMEDHFKAGMSAYLNVRDCLYENASLPGSNGLRTYYIGVVEEEWDYAPSGKDLYTDRDLTEAGTSSYIFFDKTETGIGRKYKKARFIQYTDENFDAVVPRPPEESHMGILGPVIRTEEGEELIIHFNNAGSETYSFAGQTLYFNPEMSGYSGSASGVIASSGSTVAVNYLVPRGVIRDDEPDCVVRLYYSAADFQADVNTGLVGPLLICRNGTLDNNNKPVNSTQKEIFLLFKLFDENKSLFLQENINSYSTKPLEVDTKDSVFQLSNKMQSINGYSYGNVPDIEMCLYDDVVIYLMSLGDSDDDVSVHFNGNTFIDGARNRDTIGLTSGMTHTVRMQPDNPGVWAFLSVVSEQNVMGMTGLYNVTECPSSVPLIDSTAPGVIRRFAIAAVNVMWDYASHEADFTTGIDLNDPRADGNTYVKNDQKFIGNIYKKAVFRAFGDLGFTKPISRGYDAFHLGILGPVIQAEIGDVIEIYFYNNLTRPVSIYPHGLRLDKENEGFYYVDGRREKGGVLPGQMVTYRWEVPARSGPGEGDPNCVPYLYYSAVDRARDINTGLIGPMEVCRKAILDSYGRRTDVHREFHLLFKKFNENLSWYLDDNIKIMAPERLGTPFDLNKEFEESNNMYSINGELFGNLKGLVMLQNETVAWYLHALGAKTGLNTVHFHGNTVLRDSHKARRSDTVEIYPGTSEAVTMVANNAGKWMLNSDVVGHQTAGMVASYTVVKR